MPIVQHVDKNVGPKDYSFLQDTYLLVTNIFYTHQGEGPYAGRPAIFIRLAGCDRGAKENMGCAFCDTFFGFEAGVPVSFNNILAKLDELRPKSWPDERPLIVITGGEPMMQDNLVPFIAALNVAGFYDIQIETNADRLIKGFLDPDSMITGDVVIVASPKATQRVGYREMPPEIFRRVNVFKFLIEDKEDSPYRDIPSWAINAGHGFTKRPVYLSPITVYKKPHDPRLPTSAWDTELVDHKATQLNYIRAASIAKARGLLLSMQQHLWFVVP